MAPFVPTVHHYSSLFALFLPTYVPRGRFRCGAFRSLSPLNSPFITFFKNSNHSIGVRASS